MRVTVVRLVAVGAGMVVLAIGGFVAAMLTQESGPEARAATVPSVTGVTPYQLGSAGVTLSAAAAPPSGINSSSAVDVAQQNLSGGAVLDAVLAHCTKQGMAEPIDTDCWVVTLTPEGTLDDGPPGSATPKILYTVGLVDAATGRFLLGIEGATPPAPAA